MIDTYIDSSENCLCNSSFQTERTEVVDTMNESNYLTVTLRKPQLVSTGEKL